MNAKDLFAHIILRGGGAEWPEPGAAPSQVEHYPAPEHRTMALAHQAAELYLALYFVPQVLHMDPALMRTLVDRCLPIAQTHLLRGGLTQSLPAQASWEEGAFLMHLRRESSGVHSQALCGQLGGRVGPGFRSDLAVEWESFRAARSALGGVVTAARARDQAATYAAALPGLQAQLASFLQEGKLKVSSVPTIASIQLREVMCCPSAYRHALHATQFASEVGWCGCAIKVWGHAGQKPPECRAGRICAGAHDGGVHVSALLQRRAAVAVPAHLLQPQEAPRGRCQLSASHAGPARAPPGHGSP